MPGRGRFLGARASPPAYRRRADGCHEGRAAMRFPANAAARGNVRAGTGGRPGPAFGGVSISVQALRARFPANAAARG